MNRRFKFSLVNRKIQPLAVFTAKWIVTSSCVSCGQWRPDVCHRAGQGQEQPSSDPGRGRNLCEEQSGGEAEDTSGDVQPQRDFFIKAIWFWLLTRMPACRPYTSRNNFPAVRSCQLVQGEIPEKSQQDISSPLPGERKTRKLDLCNGDWLFKRYGGWWKNENVVVALLCRYSDLCAKNVNYFPVMSPFVCGIVLSNNQWSLRQRSMQFKMPSIFSVSYKRYVEK